MVAKRRQGARGSGKAVISCDAAWGQRAGYDLFQAHLADRSEFRVGVLNGRIVSAYAKVAPAGTDPENLRPDWSHEQVHVVPAAVAEVAREGARRIGLDYAGVDVPGLLPGGERRAGVSEQTLRSLYSLMDHDVGRFRRVANACAWAD